MTTLLGVERAIASQSVKGLRQIYKLFARVDGLKLLCATFKRDVQKAVAAIVLDDKRDEEMVQRLVEFRSFINKAVPLLNATDNEEDGESHPANRDFVNAASDAFEMGFRGRKNKPAEMIAKYLDRAMRKGQQDESDEKFEEELNNVLGLYQYTQGKSAASL